MDRQSVASVAAPSEGAGDIAANVAAAAGVPAETLNVANTRGGREVERRRDREASRADPMAKVGIACCAFGNTFTLPLVFLAEVLGASYADKVAGFIALYLIGWSPALWTVGYQLLAGGDGDGSAAGADAGEEDASKSPPPASLWATTKYLVKETVNPPLIGIFLGVLIGVSPARVYLLGGASAAAAAASLPPDLGVVASAARAAFELAVLLGGATLPVQTLVLASSFVKIPTAEETEAVEAATLAKAAAAAVEVSRGATATAGRRGLVFDATRGARRRGRGAERSRRRRRRRETLRDGRVGREGALRRLRVAFRGVAAGWGAVRARARAANSPWYPNDPVVAVVVMTMAAMPPRRISCSSPICARRRDRSRRGSRGCC